MADVAETVAGWAGREPERLAVAGDRMITYGELDRRANQVAHLLREAGIGADDVVGIRLPRGTALVVAVLGVLRSGGAFLPLDPATPPPRLARLASAAGLRWMLSGPGAPPAPAEAAWRVLEVAAAAARPGTLPAVEPAPDDLAYVVFTSGSTGEPKPVAVPHRALSNHAGAVARRYHLSGSDRVLQFADPSFDVFVEEVIPTLVCGGCVVMLPESRLVPRELERRLARERVTVANLPTPYWTQWTLDLDAAPRPLPGSLRLLVVGSEVGYADTLARWRAHSTVPVINAYGLSETTVTATTAYFPADRTDLADPLPIGQVIDGGRVRVLDDRLRQVPSGESGWLYLGGDLLARGYLGRPDLTADRFVPDPTTPGRRLYRTGDLVRELPGGLQFLGRADGQVKIRGHRVEPSEVAAVLVRHPDVAQVHVAADRDPGGQTRLVAYLVPRDHRRVPSGRGLRSHLRDHLPEYLLPAAFAVLDALPRLPNGKVDRAALPPARVARRGSGTAHHAPRSPLEHRLARIWAEVLGLTQVGVTDDLLELGGHSLTATRIAARIQEVEQVPVSPVAVLEAPTIRHLAGLLTGRTGAPSAGVPPAPDGPERRRGPLSYQQEQVWFLDSLAPQSIAYHAQTTIRVVGGFDLDCFDRALTELARRHAILRTTYFQQGGELWQVVHEPAPVGAARVDLTGAAAADRERLAEELVQRELRRPFQLGALPLLRWTAIQLGPAEHELVLVEHHLVHDGWSFALLMRELKTVYNAYARAEDSPLPEPVRQYSDYAVWQRRELVVGDGGGGALAPQLGYWRERLSGMPAPLALHLDRPRPPVQTYRGDTLRIELPPELPGAVREFCRAQRVTLFTAMYAAFAALLHRYTGEPDVCIGSAYANRQVPGTQDLVGMFVNVVIHRCDVTPDMSYLDLVHQAREVVLGALRNQELPFVELVRALNPDREVTAQPVVRILFSVNDSPLPDLDFAGATGTILERGNGSAKTDLDVVVIPRAESQATDSGHADERILLLWEYNTDLFQEQTMRDLAGRYLGLLAAAVASPETAVGDLPVLTEAERDRPPTPPAGPTSRRYVDLAAAVLARAAAAPTALAVAASGTRMDYRQLADRARRLAGRLRAGGVTAGEVVAVLLPRGPELVVAELAVLVAGGAFLPLDPALPAARAARCCAEARVRYAVTDQPPGGSVPPGVVAVRVPPADPPPAGPGDPAPAGPGDPAYVIYTSGSTGVPKGVVVSRAALANLVGWHLDTFALSPADRATMFASPEFDVSVGEIWPALVAGASLHVPEEEVRLVPLRLREWLDAHRITVTDLPTSLAESLIAQPARLPGLRFLLTGGDRLTARPPHGTRYVVVNAYGPTEATVTATWTRVGSDRDTLPEIGHPIPGVTARVLDTRLRPVPDGVPGELYLGGAGLALGYLARPDLTAERFLPDPVGPAGGRLYRTGDLVRRGPDGSLEFLGRTDAQLKLRGYRIEPAEVVAALRRLPAVEQAYVTTRPLLAESEQLVAYLVGPAGGSRPDPAELRQRLAGTLPGYLVPTAYVWLDELPRTRNGKVDVARLPAPVVAAGPLARSATGETERRIAGIWREVLRREQIGVHDNFFDLGGHSLLVGQVHQRILGEIRPGLPMVALFQYPTIATLARHLDGQPATPPPAPASRTDGRDRLRQLRARR